MSIRVLDPTSGEAALTAGVARRLVTLEGAIIGLLDNSKHNVRPFLDHVEEILRERHGVREVVRRRKPDPSRPVPADVLAQFAGCDAVVSAVGD